MAVDYTKMTLPELEAEHRRLADVWTSAHQEKELCLTELIQRRARGEVALRLVEDLPREAVREVLNEEAAAKGTSP